MREANIKVGRRKGEGVFAAASPLRRRFQPLAILALMFAGTAGAAPLPEVVRDALQQHPAVRSSQALLNAAEEQVVQANSNFFPSLGLNMQNADSRDTQFGAPLDRTTRRTDAVLRWNLFRGQADVHGRESAGRDREAASGDVGDARERTVLQLTQVYLDVLRLRRQVALVEEHIADYRRLGLKVRLRADMGRVSPAEAEQVQIGLIEAEARLSQLRGQLAGAETQFRLLTGREATDLVEPTLDDGAAALDREALLDRLRVENPRVRAAFERAEGRAADVGVVGGALSPTLDLELRKRLQSDISPVPVTDTRGSTLLQLNYEVPLGGASFSRRRQAIERSTAARMTAEALLLEAQTNLTQTWESWREVRAIAARLEQRRETAKRIVDAYDRQFMAGKRSTNDLLVVRGSRLQAESDQVDNRFVQLLNNANILALLGALEKTLLGEAAPAKSNPPSPPDAPTAPRIETAPETPEPPTQQLEAGAPAAWPAELERLLVDPPIRFQVRSDHLDESSREYLDRVANGLAMWPTANLNIEGHTDGQNNLGTNQRLSELRALAVKRYLEEQGIAATRLTAQGYGGSRPIADNETAEGRARNRRIELKLIALPAARGT